MEWTIDQQGWICGDASITPMPRPKIEHGALDHVNGIIVHQTDSLTAQATLNAYANGGFGAHFLIERSGKVYQFASLQKTWHIGKLRAKCVESHSCSEAEFKLISQKNIWKLVGWKCTKQCQPGSPQITIASESSWWLGAFLIQNI